MAVTHPGPGHRLRHLHPAVAVVRGPRRRWRRVVALDSRTRRPPPPRPRADRLLLLLHLGRVYPPRPLARGPPAAQGVSARPAPHRGGPAHHARRRPIVHPP